MRTCDVEGCDRVHRAHGLCVAHSQRLRKHGDARPDVPIFKPHAGCAVEGCERSHYGHGHCRLHLRRLKVHGDVLADVPVRVVQPSIDLEDTEEL